MPCRPVRIDHGTIDNIAVLVGLCARCEQSMARLPAGTRQKRMNAAARLAASDTTGRYYTARFPDAGAALLAAHMLAHPTMAADIAAALGWATQC